MNNNYIKYLKEENKTLKQERESCLAENFMKKNRRNIEAIKNGHAKEAASFTKEESNIMLDYLIDMNNNIINLKTEITCARFGTSIVRLNQSKLERELLNLINKSEKLLKFISD